MPDSRVLVVGTTPDYIAYIHTRYPGRALFLTDHAQRKGSAEAGPGSASEIVCHLRDGAAALSALHEHLEKQRQGLSGVTCYDCEWLSLAAELAEHFGLPFPSVTSVRLSRDKFLTKKKWAERGVRCPQVDLVYTGWQTLRLIERFGGPVVLKPLTGTGSELTFRCHDKYDLVTAFRAITDGLKQRHQHPLYASGSASSTGHAGDQPILAEEFIKGREYSADFIIDGDDLFLIRVAKKLGDDTLGFGTTIAYVVPARLPGWLTRETLIERLRDAATALGLVRAVCMVDFIISKDEVVLLELTPRIGGDCLPPLVRKSCGLDTIRLALDFAEGRKIDIPAPEQWRELIGLRLFASHGGVLSGIDCRALSRDSRVREIEFRHKPGHRIVLPPEDYDSRLLGHVIFEPRPDQSVAAQCAGVKEKIRFDVEQYHDQKLAWLHKAGRQTA